MTKVSMIINDRKIFVKIDSENDECKKVRKVCDSLEEAITFINENIEIED